jgi:hypothetical protein
MGKVNGQGGYWLLYTPAVVPAPAPTPTSGGTGEPPATGTSGGTGDPGTLGTPARLAVAHNAEYDVVTEVDVRQTRTIGCGGWTEGLPRFRRVESATFMVAEDDESYPQALGFTEGKELSVYLKRGALFEFDLLEDTLVKSVRVTNPQDKARRVEVTCVHGRYTRAAALPPGFPLPQTPVPPAPAAPPVNTPADPAANPDAPYGWLDPEDLLRPIL